MSRNRSFFYLPEEGFRRAHARANQARESYRHAIQRGDREGAHRWGRAIEQANDDMNRWIDRMACHGAGVEE